MDSLFTIVIVTSQIIVIKFIDQIKHNSRGSASILHTERGIDFLAHCFHGYNKHVFSPQEL